MSNKRYVARWIDDGTYIIGNDEYGYDLCRIEFFAELRNRLSPKQRGAIINHIEDIINNGLEKMEMTNNVNF